MLFYINITWGFLIANFKPYKIKRTSTFLNVIKSFSFVIIAHVLLVFAYYVLNQEQRYSRSLLLFMYMAFFFLSLSFKRLLYQLIIFTRKRGGNYRNIIILSSNEQSTDLKNYFSSHPEYGYNVIKNFEIDTTVKNNYHEVLKEYCALHDIHEIFYSISAIDPDNTIDLISFAEERLIKISLIVDFKWMSSNKLELGQISDSPVIKILSSPLDEWANQLIKRTFDIIFSLFVIIFILSWLLPFLAIAIKLTSKGPIFFLQQRTGRDNKSFWCYKLRSMYVNDKSDTLQATKNDLRITKIGKFLRNSSLDELPQFFNVLVGNMSVVGPRPHMLKHTKDFSEETERFMARHHILPGITGLAQSKGYRGETSEFEQLKNRVKLDLFYIKNWSLLLDIKTIFNTIIFPLKKHF